MLPGGEIRYRGGGSSVNEGMTRLSSVVNDSTRRFRRLPFIAKIVFGSSMVLSLIFYGLVFNYFFKHDVGDDTFLEAQTCPACFGSSGCGLLYHGQIQLTGWSGYRLFDFINQKNVRFGTLGNQNIVLKKLGSTNQLQELDNQICKDANRPLGCDVPRVFFRSDLSVTLRKEPLSPKHIKQAAGMFTCASYRLMDRLWMYYKEGRKTKEMSLGDKLQIWFTASINPEPLLLQTFPASERWPFPEYYGACGRHIVVEHVGRLVHEFYDEPFHRRAGIAYELLKIADHLTNNDEDFALYLTDLNWSNFGIDASGKVRILDAENIIVVDKLAILAKKPKGYEDFIESRHRLCTSNDCLSFNPSDLCTHLHSDHNYYGVCVNLLDPHMESSIMPGGLLHDMPEEARDYWDLENLLNQCARPSTFKGRIVAKQKLLLALKQLHDQSTEHLNMPFPQDLNPEKKEGKIISDGQKDADLEKDQWEVRGQEEAEGGHVLDILDKREEKEDEDSQNKEVDVLGQGDGGKGYEDSQNKEVDVLGQREKRI